MKQFSESVDGIELADNLGEKKREIATLAASLDTSKLRDKVPAVIAGLKDYAQALPATWEDANETDLANIDLAISKLKDAEHEIPSVC